MGGQHDESRWWEAQEGDPAGAGMVRIARSPLLMECWEALKDGPRSQAELGERLEWTPAKVNYAVTTLARLGFAKRPGDE